MLLYHSISEKANFMKQKPKKAFLYIIPWNIFICCNKGHYLFSIRVIWGPLYQNLKYLFNLFELCESFSLAKKLPNHHHTFLSARDLSYRIRNFLFVYAQVSREMVWVCLMNERPRDFSAQQETHEWVCCGLLFVDLSVNKSTGVNYLFWICKTNN